MREQIRGAAWATLLARAKIEHGDSGGAKRWLAAFGDLFELWCRDVARMAESSTTFRGKLVLSDTIGDSSEIEDVVLVDEGRVLLVSAKARTIRKELIKEALSSASLLAWYEDFLFSRGAGDQRGGAARLLDKNVTRTLAGHHVEKGIPSTSKIFPVIVTYDHLGADNPGFYMWLTDRCRAEGLLQQEGVQPLAILHINKFELLMGLAASGGNVFEVLERRGPEERVDVSLFDAVRGTESVRLVDLEKRFGSMMTRLQARIAAAKGKRAEGGGGPPLRA